MSRNRAQVAERLMAADCKSARPSDVRRFESSPVHQKLGGVTEDGGNAEGPGSGGLSFNRKTVITLVLFAAVAVLAWQTMEPGKFRTLVFVVLGGLALRVLLGWRRSGVDGVDGVDTKAR
jgi:hypothetical protein